MTDISTIETIFEAAAERSDDLTERVYTRFFQRCPEAKQVFQYSDAVMRGSMLAVFLGCVEDQAKASGYLADYMNSVASDHRSYEGLKPSMYKDFMTAVTETLRVVLGADWTDAYEQVWQQQTQGLLSKLETSHAYQEG